MELLSAWFNGVQRFPPYLLRLRRRRRRLFRLQLSLPPWRGENSPSKWTALCLALVWPVFKRGKSRVGESSLTSGLEAPTLLGKGQGRGPGVGSLLLWLKSVQGLLSLSLLSLQMSSTPFLPSPSSSSSSSILPPSSSFSLFWNLFQLLFDLFLSPGVCLWKAVGRIARSYIFLFLLDMTIENVYKQLCNFYIMSKIDLQIGDDWWQVDGLVMVDIWNTLVLLKHSVICHHHSLMGIFA